MSSESNAVSMDELVAVSPLSSEDVGDLYRRHSRELWSGFYARCRDAELASDLVQESFRRLWSNRYGITRPVRWLRRVGFNLMIDCARRAASRPYVAADTDLIPSCDNEPWQSLMKRESREEVAAALASMREIDREVLVLKYSHDLGSTEIGRLLAIGADAVDMRLTRARRRLLRAFVELERARRMVRLR